MIASDECRTGAVHGQGGRALETQDKICGVVRDDIQRHTDGRVGLVHVEKTVCSDYHHSPYSGAFHSVTMVTSLH